MAAAFPSRRCTIIPESVLQQIAEDTTQSDVVRSVAQQTLLQDNSLKHSYNSSIARSVAQQMQLQEVSGSFTAYIFDGEHREQLPGTLSIYNDGAIIKHFGGDRLQYGRAQNSNRSHVQMGILYDGLRRIAQFFQDFYGFRLLNGNDAVVTATAYYGQAYCGCHWDINSRHIALGDPDHFICGDFVQATDVLAHELTHGIVSATSNLQYEGESGALNEHLADVFGVLCNQYHNARHIAGLREASQLDKDWDVGAHWFFFPGQPKDNYVCLRSFRDPASGATWQPKHLSEYAALPIDANSDRGGVHINSGILNHAFYIAACRAGGLPWEGIGKVWFAAMTDVQLGPYCTFARFAAFTVGHAQALAPNLVSPIMEGWTAVGLSPSFT